MAGGVAVRLGVVLLGFDRGVRRRLFFRALLVEQRDLDRLSLRPDEAPHRGRKVTDLQALLRDARHAVGSATPQEVGDDRGRDPEEERYLRVARHIAIRISD